MILAKLKVAATAGVIALGGAGLTVGGWAYTTAQVPGGVPGAPTVGKGLGATVTLVKPDEAPKSATTEEPRKITLAQIRRSQANLKQLILGMHTYHDTWSKLPTDVVAPDKSRTPLLSWRVAILPHIGEQKLYAEFKLDQPWDGVHNLKLLERMPDCLRVGFEPKGSTHTHYQVFNVVGAALFPVEMAFSVPGGPGGPDLVQEVSRVPRIGRITDGLSNTIGVVECGPPVPWTKPADIVLADLSKPLPPLAWPFKEAIVVGVMDGSALAFGRNIPERRLRDLITAAGDEVIDTKLLSRFRLPATTAEEKARVESSRMFLAAEVKALQAELTENLRLMQKDADQDSQDFDEITRLLSETREILNAKNKELAALKK